MKVIHFTIPVNKENTIHIQEDKLPHFYRHLHRHKEIQITSVLKGDGVLIAGNSMQAFHTGDIFIIGANQPHLFKSSPAYFKKNKKLSTHSLNIFVDPAGPVSSLLDFPELRPVKHFLSKIIHIKQAIGADCRKINERMFTLQQATSAYRIPVFLQLLQTLAEIKKWKTFPGLLSGPSITEAEGLRMNDVYQFTMANFSENITIAQIADIVHLTPQSFCRYFKKHSGKTYIYFLNEIRIHEACRMLMDMEFGSISEIAYRCGFQHVVSFNRVFKSFKKKSPGSFLKEYRLSSGM